MEENEINNFVDIWNNLDWSKLTDLALSIIPALLCITFHELSHGFVAYKLGDNTAKRAGRLTLNPIKHIDILGLVMMVLFKFGWAKPVPVNMNNFERPKWGMAITALAGPVSNMLLAAVVFLIYGFSIEPLVGMGKNGLVIIKALELTAYLSIALGIFNLIPLPPLDGSKVLFSLLPEKSYYTLMNYERFGMIILFILVATGVLTPFLSKVTGEVYGFFSNIAVWAYSLTA